MNQKQLNVLYDTYFNRLSSGLAYRKDTHMLKEWHPTRPSSKLQIAVSVRHHYFLRAVYG